MTKNTVLEVFNQFKGEADVFEEPSRDFDDKLVDLKIIRGVARLVFQPEKYRTIVEMVIYEDGSFKIGRCACAMVKASVAAYARASQVIEALNLSDG